MERYATPIVFWDKLKLDYGLYPPTAIDTTLNNPVA